MFLILLLYSSLALASSPVQYVCALATGFQPYQYVSQGVPHGLDIDLFKAIVPSSARIDLRPMEWRDAVAQLEFGAVDCVLGMEMSAERKKRFHFTQVLYSRKIRIFVPHDSKIKTLEQLKGKIVANDRGSDLFRKLEKEGFAQQMRLLDVATKAKSFDLLRRKKVAAMIGPARVVQELSKNSNFKVKEIEMVGIDIPVAIAFKKSDHPLRVILKNSMLRDETNKKLQLLLKTP